ncbi:MAG: hypothetical protein ACI4PS_00900, partial [Rhodocyclaceae bacterium]
MPKKNINFSWKKLSFLIFALFNSNANADNFSIIGEIPSNLKSEKDFYIQYDLSKKAFPIGIPYKNKYPNNSRKNEVSFLLADSINGQVENQMNASGNVEWRKSDFLLYADKMDYFVFDDKIIAKDNVKAMQHGVQLETPDFEMEITTKKGVAKQAHYQFVREMESRFYKNQDIIVSTDNLDSNGSNNTAMLVNV